MKKITPLFALLFMFACTETPTSSQKVLTEEEKLIQFESLKEKYTNFKYIYGENKKVTKEDLKNFMIKVFSENPDCVP